MCISQLNSTMDDTSAATSSAAPPPSLTAPLEETAAATNLANKDIPCSTDALSRSSPQTHRQELAQVTYDDLHDAQVVQHGHEGAEEDGRWPVVSKHCSH